VSFDWLGTFNKAQFDRFRTFAEAQKGDVHARITHLEAERERVGIVNFSFDSGGIPKGFTVSPANAYLARLVAAYEVLGGDLIYDLNIRNRTQPLYLVKSDESAPAQTFSDGSIMGGQGAADANSAVLVQKMKAWLGDSLDYKREYLERKILRLIDYGEQLQQEVVLLNQILSGEHAEGSLAFLVSEIEALLQDPNYRAISTAGDVFNKAGGGPFASYDAGPNRAAASHQRGFGGPQTPGEKKT